VEKTKDGASISLKLQDGRGSIVRVYVGTAPGSAVLLWAIPWCRQLRDRRPSSVVSTPCMRA